MSPRRATAPTPSREDPPNLTVSDTAKMLGVSTRTVVRWAESGALPPATRTLGGHRRFARSTVEEFARTRTAAAKK